MHCLRCHAEIDRTFKACPHCGEPVTDFLRTYAEQPLDGKYRLVERLGAGGMGDVYKVEHTYLGAIRVVKVIRAQISGSRDAHDRFLREARLATKVHHPNVATLHDFSALPDGSHYMVWEYIEGENLAQLLRRRGVLPPRVAIRITVEALAGLDAIHRAGIVHRDISPENLMIERSATGDELLAPAVKIIDLGVAKTEEKDQPVMTQTGIFVGKLRYSSPEHLGFVPDGERIDGRADLYSLAIVLYEMLTGRPPFEATSPHQYVLLHSASAELPPIDLSRIPLPLQPVLRRALERDRNQRYATAREFAAALEQVERELPNPADLKTIATPFDADVTMRVTPPPDTLHRETLHTGARTAAASEFATRAATPTPFPAPPPAYTPAPSHATTYTAPPPPPAAPPTVIEPVRPAQRSSLGLVFGILAVLFVVFAVGLALMFRYVINSRTEAQSAAMLPSTTSQTATTPPQAAQTSVDVVTSTAMATRATTATNDAAAQVGGTTETEESESDAEELRPISTVVHVTRPEPQPAEPQPRDDQPPAPAGGTYVEGGDNDDALVAHLEHAMQGVTTIAVRGSGDPMLRTQLEHLIQRMAPGIATTDGSADVVIDFNGTLERLGRGRKRRAAQATVSKHGRVIFRYELPPEDYRVGDNPAEAFARVLSNAIH